MNHNHALIATVAKNHRERKGTIITNAPDPATFIANTVRAVAGEVYLNEVISDVHIKLDSIFSIPVGGYIEYRLNTAAITDWHLHREGTTSSCRFSNTTTFFLAPVNLGIVGTWAPTVPTITGNTWYKIRINKISASQIDLWINDAFIASKTNWSAEPILDFDIIGRVGAGNRLIYDYVDFNGLRYNFNETGSDPTVYAD